MSMSNEEFSNKFTVAVSLLYDGEKQRTYLISEIDRSNGKILSHIGNFVLNHPINSNSIKRDEIFQKKFREIIEFKLLKQEDINNKFGKILNTCFKNKLKKDK